MDRRRFLATAASAGLAATAGCTAGVLSSEPSCNGVPEYDYDWEAEPFVGSGYDPTVIMTGTITNRSDNCGLDVVEITADAVDANGDVVISKSTTVRQIGPRDEEVFIIWYYPNEDEAQRIDDYELSSTVPGQEN